LTKGRGSGKTPAMMVALLKKAVVEKSQYAVSKETGIGLAAIYRYLRGVGEPTTRTLQRLADYLGVSVSVLRGEGDDETKLVNEPIIVTEDLKKIHNVRMMSEALKTMVHPDDKKRYANEAADLIIKELMDLLEIYSIVPEKLKDTLSYVILHYRETSIIETVRSGKYMDRKKTIQIRKLINEATKLLEDLGLPVW
jgi:transcriptional regulator with XRE-family HTH domain